MRLETERLIIRDFINEDLDLIYDINNHPECIKFNGWDSMGLDRCKEILDEWINNYSTSPGTGAFCVERKADKSKIGMAFIVKTKERDEYEIGFRLRRIEWDKGYAKEITRGFISYAENNLAACSVIGEVYTANIRSRNVFEKLDFIRFPYPGSDDGLIYKYEIVRSH